MKLSDYQKLNLDRYVMQSLENGSISFELLAQDSWSGLVKTNIYASLKRLDKANKGRYHFAIRDGMIYRTEPIFGVCGIKKVKNKLYFTSFREEKNDGFYYDFLTNELKVPDGFCEETVTDFDKISLPDNFQKLEWIFNYAEVKFRDLPKLFDWEFEIEPKGFNQHYLDLDSKKPLTVGELKHLLVDFIVTEKIGEKRKNFFSSYFNFSRVDTLQYIEKISLKDIAQLTRNSALRGEHFNTYDILRVLLDLYTFKLEPEIESDRTVEYFVSKSRVRIEEVRNAHLAEAIKSHQSKISALQELDFGDYTVVVPLTIHDILEEANRQRNCLASYVGTVAKGTALIYFLRHKANPEKSFVTCEYRKSGTVQAKTKGNSQSWLQNPIIKVIDKKIKEIAEM